MNTFNLEKWVISHEQIFVYRQNNRQYTTLVTLRNALYLKYWHKLEAFFKKKNRFNLRPGNKIRHCNSFFQNIALDEIWNKNALNKIRHAKIYVIYPSYTIIPLYTHPSVASQTPATNPLLPPCFFSLTKWNTKHILYPPQ